jgi:hypothetical protein
MSITVPSVPWGTLRDVITDFLGLLSEDGVENLNSGVVSDSDFGVTLPTRLWPETYHGTDSDDTVLIQLLQIFLAGVRDVASQFSRPELGFPDIGGELLDVDRGIDVLLDHTLGNQDRILVVVPIPRYESDELCSCRGQVRPVGGRTVGEYLARASICCPTCYDRLLVETVSWLVLSNFWTT